ncbi:MAG: helix-turn-helix domain-containing protein [Verrucomicrobiota bacterium JB024]|nr:helix-turn-helix domain-containing protein [Verrucomicrobiota bacterium JB024]
MQTHVHDHSNNTARLSYNRDEASEILGLSPATVDRLTKRGLLRPSRATRRPMYPRWELERFLRETSESIDPAPRRTSEPRSLGQVLHEVGFTDRPPTRKAPGSVGPWVSRPARRKKARSQSSLAPSGSGGGRVSPPSASHDAEGGDVQ